VLAATAREEKGAHTWWVLIAGEGHDEELGTWRRGRAGTRGPHLVSLGADDDEGGEDAGDRTSFLRC